MNKTDNIYIDALKFGISRMQVGLTFKELHHHLTTCLGYKFEQQFLDYFRIWFYHNFYSRDVSLNLKHGTDAAIRSAVHQISVFDEIKCVMTAEGFSTLQDYQKLQQARTDAKKAQRLALWAIWISIALGLLQIVLPLINK